MEWAVGGRLSTFIIHLLLLGGGGGVGGVGIGVG